MLGGQTIMKEKLINDSTISRMVQIYLEKTRPDLHVKQAHLAIDQYGYKVWYCKSDGNEGSVYFATNDETETIGYIKQMTLQAG